MTRNVFIVLSVAVGLLLFSPKYSYGQTLTSATIVGTVSDTSGAVVANADRIRKVLDWTPAHDDLGGILASALAWRSSLNA